ncbi:MAG TPA: hypothetical protein VLO00_06675 [Cryobacterium sp.]|nr:hypothetical protein [Cryobacterium sp.]
MPEHDQASQDDSAFILEVSPATWQVRVHGTKGQPGTVLLGYIQRVGDVFEATNLARPLRMVAAKTLDQAAASITGGTSRATTPTAGDVTRRRRNWAGRRADRRLCSGSVAEILGLDAHDVAEAMRGVGIIRPVSLFQAAAWTIGAEAAPRWLVPVLNIADLDDPCRAGRVAGHQRRLWALHQDVWRAFGAGQKIKGPERMAIAARIALESLSELAIAGGRTNGLCANELAALAWAGIDPSDNTTWFVTDPDDSETVWFPTADERF